MKCKLIIVLTTRLQVILSCDAKRDALHTPEEAGIDIHPPLITHSIRVGYTELNTPTAVEESPKTASP